MYNTSRRIHQFSYEHKIHEELHHFSILRFDIVSYSRLAFLILHRTSKTSHFYHHFSNSLYFTYFAFFAHWPILQFVLNLWFCSRYDKTVSTVRHKRFFSNESSIHGNANGNVLNPNENFLRLKRLKIRSQKRRREVEQFSPLFSTSLTRWRKYFFFDISMMNSKQPLNDSDPGWLKIMCDNAWLSRLSLVLSRPQNKYLFSDFLPKLISWLSAKLLRRLCAHLWNIFMQFSVSNPRFWALTLITIPSLDTYEWFSH